MDSMWFGLKTDTPPVIQGPVFISHIPLTFYESGSSLLSPYREFEKLTPTAVIENGVFVYDGTFEVPYAAAFDRAVKSRDLLEQHQPEQALEAAQAAIAIAPDYMPGADGFGRRAEGCCRRMLRHESHSKRRSR